MAELTHAQKLEQAGIKKYGSLKLYRQSLKERGAKGGKTKGASKRRDSEHYSRIGKVGGNNRWNRENKE